MALDNFKLDLGEAAAYSLYDPAEHKAILTDDGELIKLCKLEGIPFLCSLAIILKLYENKKLSKEETLEKMDNLERIGRYSNKIINYFKQKVK